MSSSELKRPLRRDVVLYFIAIACTGLGISMVDSSFNNYLRSTFEIGGLARSALELPRELPGFLNVFVAALLAFLPARRIGAVACLLQAAGIALLGTLSPSFSSMTLWLFIYSLGQHLFMPFQSSIGMELAAQGGEGARLGQANAIRNAAQLAGGALVVLGFRWLHFSFTLNFLIASVIILLGSVALFGMTTSHSDRIARKLVLKRRYGLFYILSVLFGTRKQLFITFAPWVIVSIFAKDTSVMAALYFLGGCAGVIFQPIIGRAVDRLGVRFMLTLEAVLLVPVCLLYGFSKFIFPEAVAFIVVSACYVVDSLLLSFGMARSIYLKGIAERPEDVAPSLSMGISIDHFFSIAVALAAGLLWDRFGFQWVFFGGALIAVLNFIATRFLPRG